MDSILGDVKLLHLMEVALQKPPTLPPNTAYTFDMGNLEKGTFTFYKIPSFSSFKISVFGP